MKRDPPTASQTQSPTTTETPTTTHTHTATDQYKDTAQPPTNTQTQLPREEILAEEHNEFGPNQSCEDHVFTLSRLSELTKPEKLF